MLILFLAFQCGILAGEPKSRGEIEGEYEEMIVASSREEDRLTLKYPDDRSRYTTFLFDADNLVRRIQDTILLSPDIENRFMMHVEREVIKLAEKFMGAKTIDSVYPISERQIKFDVMNKVLFISVFSNLERTVFAQIRYEGTRENDRDIIWYSARASIVGEEDYLRMIKTKEVLLGGE